MLGPARTTRVYWYVRLGVTAVLLLIMTGLGAAEYWMCSFFLHGTPHGEIIAIGGGCGLALCGYLYVLPWSGSVGWYDWVRWVTRVLVGVDMATYAFAVFSARFHQIVIPVCLAVGLAVAGSTYFDRKMAEAIRSMMATSVRDLADRAYAARMINDAARVPARKLKPDQRRMLAVNGARAKIAQSVANDSPDGLVSAVDDLRAILDDPPSNWLLLLQTTEDLVAAMAVKATKHGDLEGYGQALDLLSEVADQPNADWIWVPVYHYRQAEGLLILARRATSSEELGQILGDALESLDEAITQAAQHCPAMLPGLHAMRAECLAIRAETADDLAPAIAEARRGSRLGRWRPRQRAAADLVLAELLVRRALARLDVAAVVRGSGIGPDEPLIRRDVTDASRLIRRPHRPDLDQRLALLDLRAHVACLRAILAGRPRDPLPARRWRLASQEAHRMTLDRAFRSAAAWVSWAELGGNPAQCAEAYRHLMSLLPRAVSSRYLVMERYSVLVDVQEYAEEAGYWLLQAGRVDEAAVVLELGRAVSISEVMGRDRPTLAADLAEAGRSDLFAPYQAALLELAAAEREPSGTGGGFSSRLQRAWAAYDAVAREVARVDKRGRSATGVSFEDIVEAARSGPMVYLAAADRIGYAIVVTADGEASWLPLPALCRENVVTRVVGLVVEERHSWPAVSAALEWLWDNGLRDLTATLPAERPVTFVPVGALSMLPLHAAGTGDARTGGEYVLDRISVRYTPNARMLVRARDRATAMRDTPLALLAVDASGTGGSYRPLPHARREVYELGRRWAAAGGRVRTVHNAVLARVCPELEHHAIWHFACHCVVELDDILRSALLVEDGELSLEELMRVPAAPRRLAVLSACQSHQSSVDLPNEALGLPGGLMQIGFAAVLATHWQVPDVSAVFLTTRFYELWQGGRSEPCVALAEAQRWLRRGTRAELDSYLPGVLPAPPVDSVMSSRERSLSRPFAHPYHWAAFAITGF